MADWTDEDELRLSIEMALSKIKTKPRGAGRDGIYRRMGAEQIIAHLKLSNWSCLNWRLSPASSPTPKLMSERDNARRSNYTFWTRTRKTIDSKPSGVGKDAVAKFGRRTAVWDAQLRLHLLSLSQAPACLLEETGVELNESKAHYNMCGRSLWTCLANCASQNYCSPGDRLNVKCSLPKL